MNGYHDIFFGALKSWCYLLAQLNCFNRLANLVDLFQLLLIFFERLGKLIVNYPSIPSLDYSLNLLRFLVSLEKQEELRLPIWFFRMFNLVSSLQLFL